MQRIAIIGGSEFDEIKLEDFLLKLAHKYPNVTITTGNGRGAESYIKAQAEAMGLNVEVPALRDDPYGDKAMDCQITDIILGEAGEYPDVIVVVGSPSASRPSIAVGWYKRCIDWLPKHPTTGEPSKSWRPLHKIAAPAAKKKTAPKRRATKKQESLAA